MSRESARQIPLALRQFAVNHHLGTPQRAYKISRRPLLYQFLGPFGIVFGCVLIGIYFTLYQHIFSWWPLWQSMLILFIGGCWLAVGMGITFSLILSSSIDVFIFSRGLIYRKRYIEILRWNEVEKLWTEKVGDVCLYIVQRKDGMKFVLNSQMVGVGKLARFLEKEIMRRHLPRELAMYKAGDTLSFGTVTLSTQGISIKQGKQHFLWDFVTNITIDDGMMQIDYKKDEKKCTTVDISKVPNIAILKTLVEHIMNDQASDQQLHLMMYVSGRPVFFGGLSVSKQGIDIHGKHEKLSWREIACIGIGESEVMIRKKGDPPQWCAVPNWTIINLSALKSLIKYIFHELS